MLGFDGGWLGVAFGAPRFPGEVEMACRRGALSLFGRAARLQLPRKLANRGSFLPRCTDDWQRNLKQTRERDAPETDARLSLTLQVTVCADNAADAKFLSRNRMGESCNTYTTPSHV